MFRNTMTKERVTVAMVALLLAVAAEKRYADNANIVPLKEEATDRLRSVAQFLDPFKFVTYTEMIDREHKPIPTTSAHD